MNGLMLRRSIGVAASREGACWRRAASARASAGGGSSNASAVRDEFTRQSGWFEVDWSARSSLSNEQIMQFVLGATKATLGRGGGSVLDVCTGTGAFARALARDGSFNSITGIDITPAMLDEARRNADHERLHRLQFLSGDATALPFENNSFDAAVTRLAVHHLSEPALALKEMARVVKPGGHVVVVDIVVGGNDVGELCTDSDGGADPALALETNRLERLRDPSHTSMLSRSEICSLLEEPDSIEVHSKANRKASCQTRCLLALGESFTKRDTLELIPCKEFTTFDK